VKVLVTCIPQAGHFGPMMPLVDALVRGENRVVVATGEPLRQQATDLGAAFEPAGHGMDEWFGQLAARTRGAPGDGLPPDRIQHYFVPRLFAEIAAADMLDGVLAAGQRLSPDVVVFDTQAYAGPLVAALLGCCQVHHTFGPLPDPDVVQLATDAVAPLWRSVGHDVPAHAGLYRGDTVTICPASLDPALPPDGRQLPLRPAPRPVRPAHAQEPPLVYFSLGTMWASAEVVRTVLAGLADLPVRVVATLGSLQPSEVGAVPANAALHPFVPQQDLLPDAAVVVHHAGAGTMFGALAHGVPQLALPQAADNFGNAELLARSGAGLVLGPPEVSAPAVADAVTRLLADPSYALAARTIAEEIDAMPDAETVAASLTEA
jgi:UDP:flavonoid glycosyltransferase YjiC (YdhE family)